MSNAKIRQACETHLHALQPPLPTAWQNTNFNPPSGPFQAPFILFAQPEDRGYADSPFEQRGIFIVTLLYPTNQGPQPAQDRAELVRKHFERGTVLDAGGFNVIFDRTPEITGGDVEEGRFVVRVRCRFFAHIDIA